MTIAIAGATGNIGRATALSLIDSGVDDVRLLVRSAAKIPDELKGLPYAVCTYADDEAALAALKGVDALLMVSAKESPRRVADHRAFIDAASRARVGSIVYTSFLGAAPEAIFTHARDHFFTEEHIKASGIDWTFLRDSFYLEFFAALMASGEIRGPAGDGACAGVSRSDVARVAAAVLADPGAHAGKTYDLTGPEAFTMAEAARIGTRSNTSTRRSSRPGPRASPTGSPNGRWPRGSPHTPRYARASLTSSPTQSKRSPAACLCL